ncbi:MAG: tetratricopeptide repeat protein [Myxococcales bacterium]|nr:tetratricopeptide repeat protein [Myxococcales bacterium]
MRPVLGSLLLGWVALATCLGCASYQAGRLYAEGSAVISTDPAQAIDKLVRAAELAPHASEIHNHLGLAYAEAGRSSEALAAFERAVAVDCDNQAAQYNLSRARANDP